MKKLLISSLLILSVFASAFATPKDVSSAILANFNATFRGASNVESDDKQ